MLTEKNESPDNGHIVITLKDIYEAISLLRSDLGAIRSTVDLTSLAVKQSVVLSTDHEARLRTLERWAWSIPAAAIAAVSAAVATVIANMS